MKLNFIITVSFFLLWVQPRAQGQGDFSMGVAASFSTPFIINQNNYGTLDGFNNPFARGSELGYKVAVGGNLGLVMSYNFKKKHGIQWGIMIDKLGQKYNGIIRQDSASTFYDVEVNRKVNLTYIQFPLLFKYEGKNMLSIGRQKLKYYLHIGPQVGALISVFESVEIDDPDIPFNRGDLTEKDKFRNIDFGVALNNGLNYYLNRNTYFNFGIDIYVGLLDINGEPIRDLEYFSNNDVRYNPSHNFRPALNIGFHKIFTAREYY